MLKILRFALVITAIATTAMAQGKIKTDPNITKMPSIIAPTASVTADKRLMQKITYQDGYKRLNTVVKDLSDASGVRIFCGKNTKDWQTRDIPLVVYVNDMPLGKLLRAIADSTHTQFTSLKYNSKDKENELSYSICRNKKSADDIAARMESRYSAKFADAEWAWDALAAFGKNQSIDKTKFGKRTQQFSEVIACLTEEDKKKLFSGEGVTVNTHNTPKAADALRELYSYKLGSDTCLPEDTEKSQLIFSLSAVGDMDLLYLCADFTFHHPDGSISSSGYPLKNCVGALKNIKELNLPQRPPSELPKPKEDYPKDRLRILETKQDWELPILKTKITLEAPKDKEIPMFSDAVIAIAKASGYNIICEDFQSHQDAQFTDSRAEKFFTEKDTTLGEALKNLDYYKPRWLNNEHDEYDPTWLINEEDKLIIGWVNEWREHHYSLVLESFITNLSEKMNGKGAQFDDLVPIASLSRRQMEEWIKHTPDIHTANFGWYTIDRTAELSAWRLYNALTDSDKAMAKSETGLPLGKFDPAWLDSFFSTWKTLEVPHSSSDERKQQTEAELLLKKEILTDPDLLLTFTMLIKSDNSSSLKLLGEKNEEKIVLKFIGSRTPLYSPKREDELDIGSIINTYGQVIQIGNGYLYLGNEMVDGAYIGDGTYTGKQQNLGIRVICNPSGYKPGDVIEVKGISSRFKAPSGRTLKSITTRGADDIKKIQK